MASAYFQQMMAVIAAAGAGGAAPEGYDIILVAGQSNAANRTPITGADTTNANVLQFGGFAGDAALYRVIAPSGQSLSHPDGAAGAAAGPGIPFGKSYLAGAIQSGRKVLLVPVAVGGTSLVSPPARWTQGSPGGDLYEQAIDQANRAVAAAVAAFPSSRVVGIYWAQGEADVGVTLSAYQAALTSVVGGFRSRILTAASAWFVIAGQVPERLALTPAAVVIDNAHKATAAAVSRVAYAAGPAGYTSDNLHYNVPPGHVLMGQAAATVAISLAQPIGALPGAGSGLTLGAATSSTQPLSWSASSGATDYLVEYRIGSGAWTPVVSYGTGTSATVTGLSSGQLYEYRVTPIAAGGGGTKSAGVSGSTAAGSGGTTTASIDFEANTVGSPVSEFTSAGGGSIVVARNTGATGWTGKYAQETVTGVMTVSDIPSFVPQSANQTLTWARKQPSAGARDGFMLRCQTGSNSQSAAMAPGYLFQVSATTNALRILRMDPSALSVINTQTVTASSLTNLRAVANGSTLRFDWSTDGGATWNLGAAVTDTTYADGRRAIQYSAGFGGDNTAVFIDSISLTS